MVTNLTEGKPIKLILRMALPILVGNIFQQLYNTVDAVIVGRYLGSEALAAVGATTSIYWLIMWFVCGLSGGFAVVLAQYFGAGNEEQFKSGVGTVFMLSGTITAVVTVISCVFLRQFMMFMKMPEEIFEDAITYLYVIIIGMCATVSYNLFASILRAMGDSKSPFYFIIISSGLNIVLDLIFIRVFAMGVFGAGLATILSQAFSALLCAVYMFNHFEMLKLETRHFAIDMDRIKKMLSYGIPSGLCGVTTAIGILILQVAINVYGTSTIAGYTAAIKVQNFAEIFFNAYSVTMMNYGGQNLGAGKVDRLQQGFVQSMMISFVTAVVFGVISIFWGGEICSIFVADGNSAEVLSFAAKYLNFVGRFYIPFSILLVTRSYLQGMGFRSAPVIIGITETLLRIAATMYLLRVHNEMVLCYVNPVIWMVTAVILLVMYVFWIRKLRKITR